MTRYIVLLTLLLSTTACEYLDAFGVGAGDPGEQAWVVEGSFDAETRYDMQSVAGSLSGNVASWTDPKVAIREQIVGAVRANYNNELAVGVASVYGDWIGQEIQAHLLANSPAWVQALPQALSVVDAQMSMVDVQTSLLLSRDTARGAYKATQIWNGLTVFRDPNCRMEGGLNCEQIKVSFQDLLDSEYPLEVVSADFTAINRASRDLLTMEAHTVKLNYGRLALYLMTNLVLPEEPGAGLQLRDVVLAAINCRGLAGRLAGPDGVLGWNIGGFEVGLSINDLVGSCEQGVFGMVNEFVDQFNVPLSMDLAGTITMIDSDRDGRVDQLTSREIAGDVALTLGRGEPTSGPVQAQMTAWRVGDLPSDGVDPDELTNIDDGIPIWEDPNM